MRKKVLFQLVLVVLILALGGGLAFYILHTKPKLARKKPKKLIPLVSVQTVAPVDYQVRIQGFGTVYPVRTGEIVSEVAGKLVYVSPKLVAGGLFSVGEVLLKIDPRDYEAALRLAEAELRDARRNLTEIEAQAKASVEEWQKILAYQKPPPPLVAKVPQLEAAKARLEAAKAKVEKARLDLERTVIKAPFTGLVVETGVELGQYVSPGKVLAKVYEAKAVEVKVALEEHVLPWVMIPDFNVRKKGSQAKVYLRLDREYLFRGRVVRAAAKVEEKTRLLDVFVRVPHPFQSRPPLLPGFFVRVEFLGRKLKDVFVLPRGILSLEDGRWIVWIVKNERLIRRQVEPIYFAKDEVIIKKGLNPGEQVVVSPLAGPVPGMKVRVRP